MRFCFFFSFGIYLLRALDEDAYLYQAWPSMDIQNIPARKFFLFFYYKNRLVVSIVNLDILLTIWVSIKWRIFLHVLIFIVSYWRKIDFHLLLSNACDLTVSTFFCLLTDLQFFMILLLKMPCLSLWLPQGAYAWRWWLWIWRQR